MRLIHFILIVLLVILALLLWIAVSPGHPFASGSAHPDIYGMNVGGDGRARSASIAVAAYWLQATVLLLVILLIAAGVRASRRTPVFWAALLGVAAVYQFVWWRIWGGHQRYLQTGEIDYFIGFATPTAWMVYGIWGSGLGLLLIYVLGFRRFIFTSADEAAYQELLDGAGEPHSETAGER